MSALFRIPRSAWRSPISSALKLASVLFSDGTLLSARPEIVPLDLERDWIDVERMLLLEEWPFVRADLEISHAQPRSVGFVAKKDGRFAGFYLAHHFGDVGYLDMSIIAPEFRGKGVSRPLHVAVMRALRARQMSSFVVHTTKESAPMFEILGFDPGQTFTLLARDPIGEDSGDRETLTPLGLEHEAALVALDAAVFGMSRPTWIGGLLRQPSTRFYGAFRDGQLVASIATRERRGGALCLDSANAVSTNALDDLARAVCEAHRDRRLECFVRDGGALEAELRRSGFAVPAFFSAIGPLVEWRKGRSGRVGRTASTACLSWF
jgi:GNAT superfamily N-acetyltransferase